MSNVKKHVSYSLLLNLLGLSQHPHQTARRMVKYPHHFIAVEGKIHVSLAYAKFIIDNQVMAEQAFLLQQGGTSYEN